MFTCEPRSASEQRLRHWMGLNKTFKTRKTHQLRWITCFKVLLVLFIEHVKIFEHRLN